MQVFSTVVKNLLLPLVSVVDREENYSVYIKKVGVDRCLPCGKLLGYAFDKNQPGLVCEEVHSTVLVS